MTAPARGAAVATPDRIAWTAGFLLVSALIYATHFQSRDPDSALHAGIAARQARLPVAQWIAPRWWALWPGSGVDQWYVEHPAGIFFLPELLDRLGLPAEPSSYVVGVAASLAALLLTAGLVERVTSRADGRAVLLLAPLMPAAFIFRIRANHEYPMLVCLLLALVGLDRVRRSWGWAALVAAAFAGGLVIKGAFLVLVVIAAGLWLLLNPPRDPAGPWRPRIACLVAVVATGLVAVGYDAWYRAVTGHTFWLAYWRRQIGPLTFDTPLAHANLLGRHFVFYLTRLAWDPAPWSLVLVWAAWRGRATVRTPADRRGLAFVVAFALTSTLLLSTTSRFAERYSFSATFLIGAAGIVAARRLWPSLRQRLERIDARIPGLPALVWTTLIVLRIGAGSWLPRIQNH